MRAETHTHEPTCTYLHTHPDTPHTHTRRRPWPFWNNMKKRPPPQWTPQWSRLDVGLGFGFRVHVDLGSSWCKDMCKGLDGDCKLPLIKVQCPCLVPDRIKIKPRTVKKKTTKRYKRMSSPKKGKTEGKQTEGKIDQCLKRSPLLRARKKGLSPV